MGIRFFCPNGHKLNVKEFQAGRRGICPFCGARILIPTQSTRPATKSGGEPVPLQAAPGLAENAENDDAEAAEGSDSSPDVLPGEPPKLPGDPTSGKMLGPSTPVGVLAGSSPVVAPPTLPAGGRNATAAGATGPARARTPPHPRCHVQRRSPRSFHRLALCVQRPSPLRLRLWVPQGRQSRPADVSRRSLHPCGR